MTLFRTLSLRNRLRLRKRIQLLRLEFVFTIIQSLNFRLHVHGWFEVFYGKQISAQCNIKAKCLLLMSWNMRFSHHVKIVIRRRGK